MRWLDQTKGHNWCSMLMISLFDNGWLYDGDRGKSQMFPLAYVCTAADAWWRWEERSAGVRLTVAIVLLLRSIDGSVRLQLQVETLSAVQLRHDPLQLGLCGRREETEREAERWNVDLWGAFRSLDLGLPPKQKGSDEVGQTSSSSSLSFILYVLNAAVLNPAGGDPQHCVFSSSPCSSHLIDLVPPWCWWTNHTWLSKSQATRTFK